MDEELKNIQTEEDLDVDDELVVDEYIQSEDLADDVDVDETIDIIDVEDIEEIEIEVDESVGWVGGDSTRHYSLYGRDEADQHPISAITGLREELNDIEALDVVYSNERNQANYYLWEDGNVLQENRVGYFVTVCSDIDHIKICTSDDDIFGVIVDGAGFIGGQSEIARDFKYGLVVTNGAVHVRCEQSVQIDDCVISNDYGYAQKNKNGYKVVGRHQIDGIEYAEIALVTPISRMCELTNEVENISQRMDDAEINIASAINISNAAYNKAEEIGEISEESLKNAVEALNKATETQISLDLVGNNAFSALELATQAKAISESAEVAAERIRFEAVATANQALSDSNYTRHELYQLSNEMTPLTQWEGENGSGISGFVAQTEADRIVIAELSKWTDDEEGTQSLSGIISTVGKHEAILDGFVGYEGEMKDTIAQVEQKADDNGASITTLVSSVDKYSVGEYSQAYGLSREQAASILKPGYIYIPTKHETEESHKETFADETEPQEFTPGNYYVWGINDQGEADWIEHNIGSVWISMAIPANSDGKYKYWYIDSATAPTGYEPFVLYIWEDDQWKKVNILTGNASNRAVSMIRQETNEISIDVTNARGNYSGLNARLEADKEAEVALIAKVVDPEYGTIKTASIINAITDGKSSVAITGDHIILNGATTNGNGSFQIHENGYMIATGGNIANWSIESKQITKVVDLGSKGMRRVSVCSDSSMAPFFVTNNTWNSGDLFRVNWDGSMKATSGSLGGWTFTDKNFYKTKGDYSMAFGMDGVGSTSRVFKIGKFTDITGTWGAQDEGCSIDGKGQLRATGAIINGNVTATSGKIGGWVIDTNGGLYYQDGNQGCGMYGHKKHANIAIHAGANQGNIGGAPFRVYHDGSLFATKATISGTLTVGTIIQDGVVIGSSGNTSFFDFNTPGDNANEGGTIWQHKTGGRNRILLDQNGVSVRGGLWSEDDMGVGYNTKICLGPLVSGERKSFIETIFTSEKSTRLQLHDESYIDLVVNDNTSLVCSNFGGELHGTWTYTGSMSSFTSDINKKKSINNISDRYEQLFDKIQPVTYKYNDGTSDRLHTGFISQQIDQALQDSNIDSKDFGALVIFDRGTDDELWTLRYGEFIALNTWQIQKAKARIAELEDKVAELEKLIKGE